MASVHLFYPIVLEDVAYIDVGIGVHHTLTRRQRCTRKNIKISAVQRKTQNIVAYETTLLKTFDIQPQLVQNKSNFSNQTLDILSGTKNVQ